MSTESRASSATEYPAILAHVAATLRLSDRDLAALGAVAEHLVRADRPHPESVRAAVLELDLIIAHVVAAHQGRQDQAAKWLYEPSPALDGMSPRAALCMGLADRVRRLLENVFPLHRE